MSNLMKAEPGVIIFDSAKAQEILSVMLEPWKGMTKETADNFDIQTAKASRAELNRMKKELEDGRKAVKKEINKPYDGFAVEVKKLVDTIDQYIGVLDVSIKQRENRLREDRRNLLAQDYRDFAPLIASIIPLDKILEKEWLNKSFGTRKAQEQMFAKVEKIMDEYDTLRQMEDSLEFYDEDKAVFFETLSLKEALANENIRKEQVRKIQEMEARHDSYIGEQQEEPEMHYYNLTVCCAPDVMRDFKERSDVAVVKFEEVDYV